MANFDEFYASLDADSNVRGEQFEKKFALWFLKTDPIWASQVEGVWRWNDYPRRSEWGTDCGVDIILHHTNGERWAVQAKCFSPNNYLNKDELNSFIAESSDERFQGKLLISSTNKIGPNADRLLERHKVVRILLKDLRDANINYPPSIQNLYKGSAFKKYDPKPHQREAINDVLKKLKTVNKGQVIMACGTGKSLTSLWIKEKLNAKNTLVLVPSLGLLRQLLKTWTTHQNQQFQWLCVCSDSTVAKKKKNQDEWITNTSDLGISVTNDVQTIKEFLSKSGWKVIFSTYQSSKLIADAQIILNDFYFDLTIADEAHNCVGRVASYFGHILDDSKIRSRKKLFFTATPRILSKRIKNNALKKEIEVASMDDKSKFGDVLHKLNFSQAIKDDLLTDYQVTIIGVDNNEIKQKIIQRELISSNGDYIFDSESLGTYIAMLKAIKDYKLTKLISFHNLIKHAETFSINFPFVSNLFKHYFEDQINIQSDYVKGKMNTTDKDEKLEKLKTAKEKECFILSNSRCLSEGVDVPDLDGIAFIDPKHSPTDIVQAVGRAIRKSDNKTKGTIVVPVFLGEIDNIDEQILSTKFSTVWNVILALKSQDDELLETIDDLRIQLGSRKITKITSKGLEKIYFDLPENIHPKFYESLYTILVENTSDDWLARFGELKEFKEKYGHVSPNVTNSSLGYFCSNQRQRRRKGKLSQDRIDLLDSLDFIWDKYDADWQKNFLELKEFKKEHGHASPNTQRSLLGRWCSSQRDYYRRGELSKERIDLLDSLDFAWDPLETEWQNKFSELKEFKIKYGHASPSSSTGEFKELGRWCSSQRDYYRRGELSKERIDLLDSLD
ncbi:DEAD/DEAH box helicase, partial [uncultured Prochlorococcus sp.]|uniref:DEAD/DEAH box helicase n=1 Tax=uncultured Prochlorococcus sp. TaxID=159733 RepID=UPI002588B8F0